MKKKLIFLLAAVMLTSMILAPTAAATPTSLNGASSINNLDTRVISVTLATANAFDFIIDPLGLMSLAPGESGTLASITSHAGVHFRNFSPRVLNRSSRLVDFAFEYRIDLDATATSLSTQLGVHNAATAFTGTNPQIRIQAQASNARVSNLDGAATATSVAGAYLNTTPNHLLFRFGAADYIARNTGTAAAPNYVYELAPGADNAIGTVLGFTGDLNAANLWTGINSVNSKVNINIRFGFVESATGETVPTSPIDGKFGLTETPITSAFTTSNYPGEFVGGAPSVGFSQTSATYQNQVQLRLPFQYNGLTVTGVTSNGSALTSGTQFFAGVGWQATNEIGFTLGTGPGVRTIVVTLSDSSTHTITLNPA
jgi:hypothetical protein